MNDRFGSQLTALYLQPMGKDENLCIGTILKTLITEPCATTASFVRVLATDAWFPRWFPRAGSGRVSLFISPQWAHEDS